jgi:hypothetical protein
MECLECHVGPELAFEDVNRKDRGRHNGIEIVIIQMQRCPGVTRHLRMIRSLAAMSFCPANPL